MKSLLAQLKAAPGLAIFLLNAGLVIVLILQLNPFNIFQTGYAAADPVLEVDQSDVVRIEIVDRDTDGQAIVLERGDRLAPQRPEEQDDAPTPPEAGPRYGWSMSWQKAAPEASESFAADADRVAQFFMDLREVRDYYALPRSPEQDRELGMARNSNGRYECLQIRLFEEGESEPQVLYVGRSASRGTESYVRLNEDDEVYLVQANLRSATGSGEPYYFRNRRVFPDHLQADLITGLSARFASGGAVELRHQTGAWQMLQPVLNAARTQAVESLLRDIAGWKASEFPEAPPADLDRSRALELRLTYRGRDNITDEHEFVLDVLGKSEYSSWVVRRPEDGALMEITSIYLEDLFDAEAKLVEGEGSLSVPPLQ
ncbi:MAG: DUF4340 domain-containing protein [Spirochaetales bacterium]|nr:DUF4340 domain-containing protein [Leptospiraceae bacterium]MCP5480230.1 DUF4340 domain-containing protein [Spirochaetales bacterium]MCP5486371.1 DUF4340 domain-containing protein [Spirochaetales bacterium]